MVKTSTEKEHQKVVEDPSGNLGSQNHTPKLISQNLTQNPEVEEQEPWSHAVRSSSSKGACSIATEQLSQRSHGTEYSSTSMTPIPAPRTGKFSARHAQSARQSRAASTMSGQLQPVLVFSTTTSEVRANKQIMNSYKKLGGLIVGDLKNANMYCIGSNTLKKTAKFILAVASGKDIVTDKWLEEAHAKQKFPEPAAYLPLDIEKENAWKFKLSDAVARGKQGLTLLSGYDVFLTSKIQQELGDLKPDIKRLAMIMGANRVVRKIPDSSATHASHLIIGSPNNDPQSSSITHLSVNMFKTDLLTMAVLRGYLELDSDEFLIQACSN